MREQSAGCKFKVQTTILRVDVLTHVAGISARTWVHNLLLKAECTARPSRVALDHAGLYKLTTNRLARESTRHRWIHITLASYMGWLWMAKASEWRVVAYAQGGFGSGLYVLRSGGFSSFGWHEFRIG